MLYTIPLCAIYHTLTAKENLKMLSNSQDGSWRVRASVPVLRSVGVRVAISAVAPSSHGSIVSKPSLLFSESAGLWWCCLCSLTVDGGVPFRVCAPMNMKVLLRLFLWFSIIDQVEHRFYLVRCRRFDEVAISSSTTLTAKSLLYWHVALRSAFILSPDSAQWNLRGGMPLVNGVPKTYWEIAYDVLTRPPLIITYETSARKREAEALERELVQLRWSLTQLICFLHCKWRM